MPYAALDSPARNTRPRVTLPNGSMIDQGQAALRDLPRDLVGPTSSASTAWWSTSTIRGNSKTLKGMSNAAAATALAAERSHPVAIINPGTAGGHEPGLHVYDIVLGTQSVNLGSFKTGYRARGEGAFRGSGNPST